MKVWQLQSLLNEDFQSFQLGCVRQIKLVGKKRRKNLFSRSADAQVKRMRKWFWRRWPRALGVLEDLVKEKVEALPLVKKGSVITETFFILQKSGGVWFLAVSSWFSLAYSEMNLD
jgi:hypothetical protein